MGERLNGVEEGLGRVGRGRIRPLSQILTSIPGPSGPDLGSAAAAPSPGLDMGRAC